MPGPVEERSQPRARRGLNSPAERAITDELLREKRRLEDARKREAHARNEYRRASDTVVGLMRYGSPDLQAAYRRAGYGPQGQVPR